MRRALAAICCLLLQAPAWGYSVTMPTDVPVTITVDRPTQSGRGGGSSPREPREPREYASPSASSADPAEALAVLGMIVAAPVVIVGGALYLAGKRFADWLDARRRERENAERDAAEYRRWREEQARIEAEVTSHLEGRERAGREAEWTRVGVLIGALASSAEAAEIGVGTYPYDEANLETEIVVKLPSGRNKYARQNEFNAEILSAYKELWSDPKMRTILRLVPPTQYKGIIAWESSFRPDNKEKCARGARGCALIGVGLLSQTYGNATEAKGAGLSVTKTADERLDPAKAIRGGLRSLRLVEEKAREIYAEAKTAPSDEALREFVMVGHNTGYTALRQALRAGPREYNKPLADLRLSDLMRPRAGKGPLLADILNKGDQPEKFEAETKEYLTNVNKWIEAAKPKPKPKPEEKKP